MGAHRRRNCLRTPWPHCRAASTTRTTLAETYFGGNFGPVSDFNKVVDYTLANLSGYVDAVKTAGDTAPNLFDFVEQITAGYMMNTIDFGKLHVQTGLRFENTQMDTLGHTLC